SAVRCPRRPDHQLPVHIDDDMSEQQHRQNLHSRKTRQSLRRGSHQIASSETIAATTIDKTRVCILPSQLDHVRHESSTDTNIAAPLPVLVASTPPQFVVCCSPRPLQAR